jgi:radical SAM/Cys-rich protein
MRQLETKIAGNGFEHWLTSRQLDISPLEINTLWLNITRLCNQSCSHCHVEASPNAKIQMTDDVIYQCLIVLRKHEKITTVDLTGGAPELHPRFEQFVETCMLMNKRIIVRHNLTVTLDGNPVTGESKQHLPQFFAANRVEILASLPFCDERKTDAVRGKGVFQKSIESLRRLNQVGYGADGLSLKLVINSDGPLTAAQRIHLEQEFINKLSEQGIRFDGILTVTNLPLGRYAESPRLLGYCDAYKENLKKSANESSAESAVCRSLVTVGVDGLLYDCDFNFAKGLPIGNIFDFNYDRLITRRIQFDDHCFGCIAGAGSG